MAVDRMSFTEIEADLEKKFAVNVTQCWQYCRSSSFWQGLLVQAADPLRSADEVYCFGTETRASTYRLPDGVLRHRFFSILRDIMYAATRDCDGEIPPLQNLPGVCATGSTGVPDASETGSLQLPVGDEDALQRCFKALRAFADNIMNDSLMFPADVCLPDDQMALMRESSSDPTKDLARRLKGCDWDVAWSSAAGGGCSRLRAPLNVLGVGDLNLLRLVEALRHEVFGVFRPQQQQANKSLLQLLTDWWRVVHPNGDWETHKEAVETLAMNLTRDGGSGNNGKTTLQEAWEKSPLGQHPSRALTAWLPDEKPAIGKVSSVIPRLKLNDVLVWAADYYEQYKVDEKKKDETDSRMKQICKDTQNLVKYADNAILQERIDETVDLDYLKELENQGHIYVDAASASKPQSLQYMSLFTHFQTWLDEKRNEFLLLKSLSQKQGNPFPLLRELIENRRIKPPNEAENRRVVHLYAFNTQDEHTAIVSTPTRLCTHVVPAAFGGAANAVSRSAGATAEGLAYIDFRTVGLPKTQKYLLLNEEASEAFLTAAGATDTPGAVQQAVALAFTNEEQFEQFKKRYAIHYGAATAIARPVGWMELLSRLRDKFHVLTIPIPRVGGDHPPRLRWWLSDGAVRAEPSGTTRILPSRGQAVVLQDFKHTSRGGDDTVPPTECLALAVLVRATNSLQHHAVPQLLDVVTQAGAEANASMAPLNIGQQTLCEAVAAASLVRAAMAPGKYGTIFVKDIELRDRNAFYADMNLSLELMQNPESAAVVGPESPAGVLYRLFPGLFHQLAAGCWRLMRQQLTCDASADATGDGLGALLSTTAATGRGELSQAFPSLALAGDKRQVTADVRDMLNVLFSGHVVSAIFAVVHPHIPFLLRALATTFRVEPTQVVVEAANFDGILRRLNDDAVAAGSHSWSPWRPLILHVNGNVAPLDLKRLLLVLAKPRFATFLVYDPLVMEHLRSLGLTQSHRQWIELFRGDATVPSTSSQAPIKQQHSSAVGAASSEPTRLSPCVRLTRLVPATTFIRVPFENSPEGVSAIVTTAHDLGNLTDNSLLSVHSMPPLLLPADADVDWQTHVRQFAAHDSIGGTGSDTEPLQDDSDTQGHPELKESKAQPLRILALVGVDAAAVQEVLKDVPHCFKLMPHDADDPRLEVLLKTAQVPQNGPLTAVVHDMELLSWETRALLLQDALDLATHAGKNVRQIRLVFVEREAEPRYATCTLTLKGQPWPLRAVMEERCVVPLVRAPVGTDTDDYGDRLQTAELFVEDLSTPNFPTWYPALIGALQLFDDSVAAPRASVTLKKCGGTRVLKGIRNLLGQEGADVAAKLSGHAEDLLAPLAKRLKAQCKLTSQVAHRAVVAAAIGAAAEDPCELAKLCFGGGVCTQLLDRMAFAAGAAVAKLFAPDSGNHVSALYTFASFVPNWPPAVCATQLHRLLGFVIYLERYAGLQALWQTDGRENVHAGDGDHHSSEQTPTGIVSMRDQQLPISNQVGLSALKSFCSGEATGNSLPPATYGLSPRSTYTSANGDNLFLAVARPGCLDYNTLSTAWAAFPFGSVALLQTLETGPEPLLYMLAISSESLERLLNGGRLLLKLSDTTQRRLAAQIKAMAVFTTDGIRLGKEHGRQYSALQRTQEKLGLIKWLAICGDLVSASAVDFDNSDLDCCLKRSGITRLERAQYDPNVLRLLVQLDEVGSNQQPFLVPVLDKLSVDEVRQAAPPGRESFNDDHHGGNDALVVGAVATGRVAHRMLSFRPTDTAQPNRLAVDDIVHMLYKLPSRQVEGEHDQAIALSTRGGLALQLTEVGAKHLLAKLVEMVRARHDTWTTEHIFALARAVLHGTGGELTHISLLNLLSVASGNDDMDVLSVVAEAAKKGVLEPVTPDSRSDDVSGNTLRSILATFVVESNTRGGNSEKAARDAIAQLVSSGIQLPVSPKYSLPVVLLAKANRKAEFEAEQLLEYASALFDSQKSATELTDWAMRLQRDDDDAHDLRLNQAEKDRVVEMATAAWCRYPSSAYFPALWVAHARASQFGERAASKYFKPLKQLVDCVGSSPERRAENDPALWGEVARSLFCPPLAQPTSFAMCMEMLGEDPVLVVYSLEDLPGFEVVAHTPLWKPSSSALCERLMTEALTPVLDQEHAPGPESMERLLLSHGASAGILKQNVCAYFAALVVFGNNLANLDECIEAKQRTEEGEQEDDDEDQTVPENEADVNTAFAAAYYLELWFASFGAPLHDWPGVDDRHTPRWLQDVSQNLQGVPGGNLGDFLRSAQERMLHTNKQLDLQTGGLMAIQNDSKLKMTLLDAHYIPDQRSSQPPQLFGADLPAFSHTVGVFFGSLPEAATCLVKNGESRLTYEEYKRRQVGAERVKWLLELFSKEIVKAAKASNADVYPMDIILARACQQVAEAAAPLLQKEWMNVLYDHASETWKADENKAVFERLVGKGMLGLFDGMLAHKVIGKRANPIQRQDGQRKCAVEASSKGIDQIARIAPAGVEEVIKAFSGPTAESQAQAALNVPGAHVDAAAGGNSHTARANPAVLGNLSKHDTFLRAITVQFAEGEQLATGTTSNDGAAGGGSRSGLTCREKLQTGGWLVDARGLLKFEKHVDANGTGYDSVRVLDGDMCYLLHHKAHSINRALVGANSDGWLGGAPALQFLSIAPQYPSSRLMAAGVEILAAYSDHRDAWMQLDRELGEKCVVVADGGLLERMGDMQQRWQQIRLPAPPPLTPLPTFLHEVVQRAPSTVTTALHALLECLNDHESPKAQLAQFAMATVLENNGDELLEREYFEQRAAELGVAQEGTQAVWTSICGALGYRQWLCFLKLGKAPPASSRDGAFLFHLSAEQTLSEKQQKDATEAARQAAHAQPESAAQDAATRGTADPRAAAASGAPRFLDLLRRRRDLQSQCKTSSALTVAVIFDTKLLAKCRATSGTKRGEEEDDQDQRLEDWLLDVLSSPLLPVTKYLFLHLVKQGPRGTKSHGNGLAEQDLVIAVTLAQCCPHAAMRKALLRIVSPMEHGEHNAPLRLILERRDERYGIVICKKGTLRQMEEQAAMKTVVRCLDARLHANRDQALFLAITKVFDPNCHIVYVQHLTLASDIFLKWCCEYTRWWPWRFIFFEATHVATNFPEIRDRCRFLDDSLALAPERRVWSRPSSDPSSRDLDINDTATHVLSQLADDWDEKVLAKLKGERAVVLLTSSPGVGKTHFARRLKKNLNQGKKTCDVVNFDCSDDRLVERGLSDLLDDTFAQQKNEPACLVADEFHLLTPRQKSELFTWLKPRLDWLRVLLIGNRVLRVDKREMDKLRHDRLCDEGYISEFEVARSPDSLCKVCKDTNRITSDKEAASFKLWYGAVAVLLGLEALSLRDAFATCKDPSFHVTKKSDDYIVALASRLQRQMPLLSDLFCRTFAEAFVDEAVARDCEPISLREGRPLLQTLCEAAMWLSKKNRVADITSFVAFARAGEPQRWRPEKRAQRWLAGALKGVRLPDGWRPEEAEPSYTWLDQDPFPYVEMPGRQIEAVPNTHPAASTGLTVNSLARLRYNVVHHVPVDWVEVQRDWAEQPPTDLVAFEELLQDSPNKLLPLDALAGQLITTAEAADGDVQEKKELLRDAMCTLAERSASSDSILGLGAIAKSACDAYRLNIAIEGSDAGDAALSDNVCVLYTIWRYLLVAGTLSTSSADAVTERLSAESKASRELIRRLRERPGTSSPLLLCVFRWAGRASAAFGVVYCSDRATEKLRHEAELHLLKALGAACELTVEQHLNQTMPTSERGPSVPWNIAALNEIFTGPLARAAKALPHQAIGFWTLLCLSQVPDVSSPDLSSPLLKAGHILSESKEDATERAKERANEPEIDELWTWLEDKRPHAFQEPFARGTIGAALQETALYGLNLLLAESRQAREGITTLLREFEEQASRAAE